MNIRSKLTRLGQSSGFNILNFQRRLVTMKNLGNRIRTLREEKQLSLPKLAKIAEVSQGLLSKLENSDDPNTSLSTLEKIADALDVTLADLLGEEKVVGKRFVPDIPPNWRAPLLATLKKEGKKPDEDILQALYVLQQRKGDSKIDPDKIRWLYGSVEMSLRG